MCGPFKDFAQQRRDDLQDCHALAADLLRKQSGILHDVVAANMNARADHQAGEKLPDRDDEALWRSLGDDVRRR